MESKPKNPIGNPVDLATTEVDDSARLSDIFDEGLRIFHEVSKTNEPTNSPDVQAKIKRGMSLLEDATRLVSMVGMFSSNESVEEVPTSAIKYFLLPVLLGTLSLKLCVTDRLELITTAEVYFRDFLQRVKDYGIVDIEIPPPVEIPDDNTASDMVAAMHTNRSMDLMAMASQRHAKIARFKEQQLLEEELDKLKVAIESEDRDEEIYRQYFLTMCKSFGSQALDELSCLDSEKPLLAHRAKVKKEEAAAAAAAGSPDHERERPRPKLIPRKPLLPVIITKDEVQKKVFGAGYPSLPTMTVQEFYEQRTREGIFPGPGQQSQQSACLQTISNDGGESSKDEAEEIAKEQKIESDDPDYLAQQRNWDDHKDDHRRGWGNRMNRS